MKPNPAREYAEAIIENPDAVNKERIQMAERFLRDLDNPEYEYNPHDAEFVIQVIERTIVHKQGETLEGRSLRGTPFLLQEWQKFIIYNLLGFYHKGTENRRYKEAFIYVPRKNGKTSLIAALAWALALLERKSGSTVYVVGASLKQSMQSFEFIRHNLRHMGEEKSFRILDNNMEHSISGEIAGGYIHIQALASNPDAHDSLNCNIAIADELHAYKNAKQYNVIKEAMKAYTNKLMIGITTAGDNMVSFCYQRLVYCKKILDGSVKDEAYFVFIAKADESEGGEVDYANAIQHRKANPSYGITIRPDDIMNDATQAQNDPQQRKDFLSKSLNIYTSSARAYFNLDTFRASDKQYNWTIDELAKLPIEWFGGADLSKMHDLTAAALKGCYKGVDISITHAFFPITRAHLKADEDNIPLFGWQDDGWLTMSNGDITNHSDIVRWFMMMRDKGFRIKQIGFDRKFGEEFFLAMKNERFSVVDEPQLFINKSKGFRRIEQKAIAGKFYYLHSQAYEYCLENVHGIEKTDDMIQYEKVMPHMRIDLFDADVFATCRMIGNLEKSKTATKWLQSGKGGGE